MKQIILSQGKVALVDDKNFELLNQYKWSFMKGYAIRFNYTDKGRRTLYMHREIIKTPMGLFTDHIDRNKLNNQKNNLRIVTKSQNAINSKLPSNNKSGIKGICKTITESKYKDKIYRNVYWLVQLKMKTGKKKKYIGKFKELNDAIQARHEAEIKYFGDYRPIVK